VSCCTICYLVFWPDSDSFSNAEDQDSHTISLSQLEVILIKMRFMEEDAVYQAKRVLVLIDSIERENCIGGNRTLSMSCYARHGAHKALVFILEMHVQQLKNKT